MKKKDKQKENETMYIQSISWGNFLDIVKKVTEVNVLYTYTMPNKAESYSSDLAGLVETLSEYLGKESENNWRVSKETHVKFASNGNGVSIGGWNISDSVVLAIPHINSFILIPDCNNSTYNGNKEPAKILLLSNCVAIIPMLLTMKEVMNEDNPDKCNISIGLEEIKLKNN